VVSGVSFSINNLISNGYRHIQFYFGRDFSQRDADESKENRLSWKAILLGGEAM
jgi:hypothetical protein